MKIEVTDENAGKLMLVAKMLELDPDQLLNEWLLRDELTLLIDAQTGALHDLHESIVYDDAKDAKRVAVRLMSWERKEMGKDWGLPGIKVQGES